MTGLAWVRGVRHQFPASLERLAGMPLAAKPVDRRPRGPIQCRPTNKTNATPFALLDPARGPKAPHPFYLTEAAQRADMQVFLLSLDTGAAPAAVAITH